VEFVGDLNGDGFDELAVGAYGAGKAFVLFGQGVDSRRISSCRGSTARRGFQVFDGGAQLGPIPSRRATWTADGAVSDLVIGAPECGTADAGAAYVIFGRVLRSGSAFDLSTLDGANGFKLTGVEPRTGRFSPVGHRGHQQRRHRTTYLIIVAAERQPTTDNQAGATLRSCSARPSGFA
jgi:hypothetical protein